MQRSHRDREGCKWTRTKNAQVLWEAKAEGLRSRRPRARESTNTRGRNNHDAWARRDFIGDRVHRVTSKKVMLALGEFLFERLIAPHFAPHPQLIQALFVLEPSSVACITETEAKLHLQISHHPLAYNCTTAWSTPRITTRIRKERAARTFQLIKIRHSANSKMIGSTYSRSQVVRFSASLCFPPCLSMSKSGLHYGGSMLTHCANGPNGARMRDDHASSRHVILPHHD
jgi:hypothetical protein